MNNNSIFTIEVQGAHGKTFLDIKDSPQGRYLRVAQTKFGKRIGDLTFQEDIDELIKALQQAKVWLEEN